MNKAEIERVVQLARAAQGKTTKRPASEIIAAERSAMGKYVYRPVTTGSKGLLTTPGGPPD